MKTVYCQMANTPLNLIITYFLKITTKYTTNDLQKFMKIFKRLKT